MTGDEKHECIVDSEQLVAGLRAIGVRAGDVLFFHSSLRSFGRVEGGPDAVIDSAMESVSPGGTVVVPTFVQRIGGAQASYSQRRVTWDIERSASDVGLITEAFRKRAEAVRSDDPCNSLAAIGPEAEEVMSRHGRCAPRLSPWGPMSFGVGSPWDWLIERNAAYLLMGVGFTACSLFHYAQVLWMQRKYGDRLDARTWPKFDLGKMGELITAVGLVTETTVGRSRWRAFRTAPCVEKVLEIMQSDPSIFEEIRFRLWRE